MAEYESWSDEKWRAQLSTGTWTWDGILLTLRDATPTLENIDVNFQIHKGMLVVARAGPSPYNSKGWLYPLLIEKR